MRAEGLTIEGDPLREKKGKPHPRLHGREIVLGRMRQGEKWAKRKFCEDSETEDPKGVLERQRRGRGRGSRRRENGEGSRAGTASFFREARRGKRGCKCNKKKIKVPKKENKENEKDVRESWEGKAYTGGG